MSSSLFRFSSPPRPTGPDGRDPSPSPRHRDHRLLLLLALFLACVPAFGQDVVGLDGAIRAALTRNPAVAGKRAEVGAKQGLGDAARAQRYPSLSAQLSASETSSQASTLRARQPLWAFGRIDSAIAYADADINLETADLLRVQRQLTEQTAIAYAKVQGLVQRQKVMLENVALHEQFFGQIQRRERGQLASQADVRLADSRLIQARAQKERLDGDLRSAVNDLQALTQAEVDTGPEVAASRLVQPDPFQLEALALDNSAEIALRMRQLALASADSERERRASMPTVYLQVDKSYGQSYARNDVRTTVVIEGGLDGLGFATRGRTKAALDRELAATESLNATRNEVRRNLRGLVTGRATQDGLRAAQTQSVQDLDSILTSYRRQYEAGRKAWLDVLNVLREATDQRLAQVQADNDWLIYSLRIAAITGGLDPTDIP